MLQQLLFNILFYRYDTFLIDHEKNRKLQNANKGIFIIQAQQEGQRLTTWTGLVASVNGDAW